MIENNICDNANMGTCFHFQRDVVQGGFLAFNALRKKYTNMKTMVAVGGWAEGGKKYSQMASDPVKRKKFIDSVVRMYYKLFYFFPAFNFAHFRIS